MTIDLSSDAGIFLGDFGESVTYWPISGYDREITAIVERNPPDEVEGSPFGGARLPKLWIGVKNNADTGIATDEITVDQDEIEVSYLIGTTPERRKVLRILPNRQDTGMVWLEVKA